MNDVPPSRPVLITFATPDERRRLPVPLGAEAEAVRHQPLRSLPEAGGQAVEILERVGDAPNPPVLRKPRSPASILAASRSDARRSPSGPSEGARSYASSVNRDELVDIRLSNTAESQSPSFPHSQPFTDTPRRNLSLPRPLP